MTDAERIKELEAAIHRLRNGYADAVAGMRYIEVNHGRFPGVGWDRVYDHFHDHVEMPEHEGLMAGSRKLAAI